VIVLLAALAIVALVWLAAALLATDFSLPAADARSYRRPVAVFAHPDDEVVCGGGSLHRLARLGARVTLVILTEGERGSRTPKPGLGAVRVREARASAAALSVADLVHANLGDHQLRERADQVSAFLERTLDRLQPDLLITHDLAGLYGHPDHITCAETVTELRRTRFPACALWYAALPRRLVSLARLVDDPRVEARRAVATCRLFVGRDVPARFRALRAHATQRAALGWLIPLWLSVAVFEHFEAVP
jgi:LmbE family N-acetylglucosaminyl deacetylase